MRLKECVPQEDQQSEGNYKTNMQYPQKSYSVVSLQPPQPKANISSAEKNGKQYWSWSLDPDSRGKPRRS